MCVCWSLYVLLLLLLLLLLVVETEFEKAFDGVCSIGIAEKALREGCSSSCCSVDLGLLMTIFGCCFRSVYVCMYVCMYVCVYVCVMRYGDNDDDDGSSSSMCRASAKQNLRTSCSDSSHSGVDVSKHRDAPCSAR